MVDDFEVKPIFEDRPYERHQFKFCIDGKVFKGDYDDGEIQWLHPHPKQLVGEHEVKSIEAKVHELLGEYGLSDDGEEIEVQPMLKRQASQIHMFKLTVRGEEFKGTFQDGKIEWFHPKPRRKLKEDHVEKIEEKVQEKMKDHLEE